MVKLEGCPAFERTDGRVAEGARLESVYTARYPGFESLSVRHNPLPRGGVSSFPSLIYELTRDVAIRQAELLRLLHKDYDQFPFVGLDPEASFQGGSPELVADDPGVPGAAW